MLHRYATQDTLLASEEIVDLHDNRRLSIETYTEAVTCRLKKGNRKLGENCAEVKLNIVTAHDLTSQSFLFDLAVSSRTHDLALSCSHHVNAAFDPAQCCPLESLIADCYITYTTHISRGRYDSFIGLISTIITTCLSESI